MTFDDDEDEVRAIVRRAALSIEVQDREQQILAPGAGGRRRSPSRLIPLAVAAAIGSILIAVAVIRAGPASTDRSPAASPVSTSTRQEPPASSSTGSTDGPGTGITDGWTAGTEIAAAVKDGVPVAELRKVAIRTAQLLQAGDVQGLLGLQRPDLARSDVTADFVDDLGGHPTRVNIYFDATQPDEKFASVALGVDCEASGLRASISLKFGLHQGVWYLNLADGFGGVMTQEEADTSSGPPSTRQELSCGGSK